MNLIIAPHGDDEVLGCSSALKDGFVYYCGVDESKVAEDKQHRIGAEKKFDEITQVAEFMGFKWKANSDTRVNFYKVSELIGPFEKLINELKPDRIYIPFPSYNQDHQAGYKAAQIALRPHDKNFFVKKVLLYEQPQSIVWEHKSFKVNHFVPIDIEKKIKAYLLYKSQVRPFRSPELVRAIARVRGSHIGEEYAEAFHVQRWVE